jgi:hypothetical protein
LKKRKNQNKGRERAGGRLTDCLREKKKIVQRTEEMLNNEDDDYFILYLTHTETTS